MPLRDVTPMDIGDFITQNLPLHWSDVHVSHQLGALRCFFDFLYMSGIVDSVAPRFLRSRGRIKKLPRTLTQAQVKKLLRAATHPRDRALVELFYATGCRVSEMAVIRVEHIDFTRRRIPVRAKRKERVVYFGLPASRAIRKYLSGRRSGYLIQDVIPQQKGQPITKKHGSDIGEITAPVDSITANGSAIRRTRLTRQQRSNSNGF